MAQTDLLQIRRPSVPMHVEVANMIRNKILSGELSVGEQLPALSQLSQDMNLAKMTVRKAMDSLEAEGLIERKSGRGTFVRDVAVRQPQYLRLEADFDQLFKMVEALEVGFSTVTKSRNDASVPDNDYIGLTRVHMLDGKPFCLAELKLDRSIYDQAPDRFNSEIVILVLRDLGVSVASARQRVSITYADVNEAESLGVHINSPLMQVNREFFTESRKPVYTAMLMYPGDALGLEIEFKV